MGIWDKNGTLNIGDIGPWQLVDGKNGDIIVDDWEEKYKPTKPLRKVREFKADLGETLIGRETLPLL